jgi:SAM-dependent methyltransferase
MKHLPWSRLLALAGLRVVGTGLDVLGTLHRPRLWRWWLAQALAASPWRAARSDVDGVVDDDLVYGEMFVLPTWLLLRRLGVSRQHRVVDLGCGRGAVLVAGLLCNATVRGVELVPARLQATTSLVPDVALALQDARSAVVSDADVVWLSWATWSEALRTAVTHKLAAELPDHALVVGLVHDAETTSFERVLHTTLWCSWGRTEVVVSRRRAR